MITEDDVKNKTPSLEQFLLEAAKELGAKEVVMFDGTVKSLNQDEPQGVMLKHEKSRI